MNDLYKVENSFKQLVNNFYELTDKAEAGEVSQEEYNMIGEQLALELRNKSTNVVCYCQNEKTDIEAIGTEINRLTELKKSKENRLNNFKEYVKTNMERLNL